MFIGGGRSLWILSSLRPPNEKTNFPILQLIPSMITARRNVIIHDADHVQR